MDREGGKLLYLHNDNKTLAYTRGDYLFIFNFHPTKDNWIDLHSLRGQKFRRVMGTAEQQFGGWIGEENWPVPATFPEGENLKEGVKVPRRCAFVYKKVRSRRPKEE